MRGFTSRDGADRSSFDWRVHLAVILLAAHRIKPLPLPQGPAKRALIARVLVVLLCLPALAVAGGTERPARGAWVGRGVGGLAGAAPPERIVSLTPGVTETLFAIGANNRVVGVSDYCDYPSEVSSLPRVGSFLAPVVEAVIRLQPDLVIISPSPGNKNAVAALERAGIAVKVVGEGSGSLAEVRATILEIASAVGLKIEGEALVASIDTILARVRKQVAGLDAVSVAMVVGYEPLVLAGPDSYLGELIELAGGRNIADALTGKWPRTGWEFLLAAKPEVVIEASASDGGAADAGVQARRWSRYREILPAVAEGRVYSDGASLLLHPGPRLGEQATLISRYLHPPHGAGGETGD